MNFTKPTMVLLLALAAFALAACHGGSSGSSGNSNGNNTTVTGHWAAYYNVVTTVDLNAGTDTTTVNLFLDSRTDPATHQPADQSINAVGEDIPLVTQTVVAEAGADVVGVSGARFLFYAKGADIYRLDLRSSNPEPVKLGTAGEAADTVCNLKALQTNPAGTAGYLFVTTRLGSSCRGENAGTQTVAVSAFNSGSDPLTLTPLGENIQFGGILGGMLAPKALLLYVSNSETAQLYLTSDPTALADSTKSIVVTGLTLNSGDDVKQLGDGTADAMFINVSSRWGGNNAYYRVSSKGVATTVTNPQGKGRYYAAGQDAAGNLYLPNYHRSTAPMTLSIERMPISTTLVPTAAVVASKPYTDRTIRTDVLVVAADGRTALLNDPASNDDQIDFVRFPATAGSVGTIAPAPVLSGGEPPQGRLAPFLALGGDALACQNSGEGGTLGTFASYQLSDGAQLHQSIPTGFGVGTSGFSGLLLPNDAGAARGLVAGNVLAASAAGDCVAEIDVISTRDLKKTTSIKAPVVPVPVCLQPYRFKGLAFDNYVQGKGYSHSSNNELDRDSLLAAHFTPGSASTTAVVLGTESSVPTSSSTTIKTRWRSITPDVGIKGSFLGLHSWRDAPRG